MNYRRNFDFGVHNNSGCYIGASITCWEGTDTPGKTLAARFTVIIATGTTRTVETCPTTRAISGSNRIAHLVDGPHRGLIYSPLGV